MDAGSFEIIGFHDMSDKGVAFGSRLNPDGQLILAKFSSFDAWANASYDDATNRERIHRLVDRWMDGDDANNVFGRQSEAIHNG